MRAVAVPIDAVAAGEVDARHHRRREGRMRQGHARVDHRHAHTGAGQRRQLADAGPHLVGADRLPRHVARRPHRRVRRQVLTASSARSASSCPAFSRSTAPLLRYRLTLRL